MLEDLAELLVTFGCKGLYHDSSGKVSLHGKPVPFHKLFEESDLLSIHIPLHQYTEGIIGADELSLMRKGSYLINTSRGGILDEKALFQFLLNDHLAGAALDVLAEEPPKNSLLLSHKNVIVTPHIGGSTKDSIYQMGMAAINGLSNYMLRKVES